MNPVTAKYTKPAPTDLSRGAGVPARLVLLSLAALWACYFIIASMRGAVMGMELGWEVISRRLTICIVSMLVMAATVPLFKLLEHRSGGVRFLIVLVGALPLSLALSVINNVIFSDINVVAEISDDASKDLAKNLRISRDVVGNILIDIPESKKAPEAIPSQLPEEDDDDEDVDDDIVLSEKESASASEKDDEATSAVTIKGENDKGSHASHWALIVDTAFGRYFLVVAWAALYFALAKAEEARAAERREGEYRRAAQAAELRSLRYQVNPHFLFNTLNSLSALVMVGRQDDAEEMIQNLSTFYRRTLSGDVSTDIALRDEIEMQRLYFAIEAVRFPDRLLTKIVVDESVLEAKVPSLILQPLIENSVKYAVAATQRPVTITIEAYAEAQALSKVHKLVLVVRDDGPGTYPSHVEGIGIGLVNVRDRLRARYGDAAQIAVGG